MDILYLLIPMSALLVLLIIGVFGWALHRGQFDDLEREGVRILQQDGPLPLALTLPLDASQAEASGIPEQSPQRPRPERVVTPISLGANIHP